MCGIAGVCGRRPPLDALKGMTDLLAHRGPDGEGYAVGTAGGDRIYASDDPAALFAASGTHQVGLAHRRLAIIDLSDANRQPALDASQRVALAYNGELYNYVELADELRQLGHRFHTTGDTEVVLRAYLEWGPACVERFVGMWAFAVADLNANRLLLSRDRFGIKPLYWCSLAGGGMAFASEIKAFRAIPGVRWEPDAAVSKRYLLSGNVDEREETFFEGIRRVLPATNVILPLDGSVSAMRVQRYWAPPVGPSNGSASDDAARVRETLREAVRVHLRSDVPVGTCLSGGIDSSGIVALCDELRRGGVVGHYTHHAFGYVPPDGSLSELPYMRAVVSRTGAALTIVQPTAAEFDAAALDVVRQQDEPFGTLSIAAQHFVFAAARDGGLKVMLDGQGADETFAGYHHHLTHLGALMLRRRQLVRYARFAARHQRRYGRQPLNARSLVAASPLAPAAMAIGRRRAGAAPYPVELLAPPLRATRSPQPEFAESLHATLVQETTETGLPGLLRFEDRNSMAHSIEGRVPYLDHRVAELALSLPEAVKVGDLVPKHVLRRALHDLLPPEVTARRDKIGFRADPSATHRLVRANEAALREARTPWEREWLEPTAVHRLLSTTHERDHAEYLLWRLVNLKIWLRQQWDGGRHPIE